MASPQNLATLENLIHLGVPVALAQEWQNVLATLQGGAGTATFAPSGTISANVTAALNTATNTLLALSSYSIPANTLDVVGRGIFVEAFGTLAGNAQNKSLRLAVGGLVINSGSFTSSGSAWSLSARVQKTAANAQLGLLTGYAGTTGIAPVVQTDTSVDTGAIVVALSALSGSASASDITCNALIVRYFG